MAAAWVYLLEAPQKGGARILGRHGTGLSCRQHGSSELYVLLFHNSAFRFSRWMGGLVEAPKRFPIHLSHRMTVVAACGGIAFFVYSQLRGGHWDIYMAHTGRPVGVVPDYLAC